MDILTQTLKGNVTHRFSYDHDGARVSYFDGTATTTYPNDYYDTQGATTTKHIYAQGALIATIEKTPATTTASTLIIHTDHLGGTSAVTNAQGLLVESLTYCPFGAPRIDQAYGAFSESRKYIGEEYDTGTSLNYLNARYYNGAVGRFMSQDPTHLALGNNNEIKKITEQDLEKYLSDPQILNSYSYAKNNPIILSDPSGKFAQLLLGAGGGILGQYAYDVYDNIQNNGLHGSAFTNNLSNKETYLTRGAQGVLITLSGGVAGLVTSNTIGQVVIVGGASGLLGVGGNYTLGQQTTPQSVVADTIIGGLTFGAVKSATLVPGRIPKPGTKAFFVGKHTQQNAASIGIDAITSYVNSLFGNVSSKNNKNSNSKTLLKVKKKK